MSNEKDWDNFKQKLFAKSTINLNDYKRTRCSGGLVISWPVMVRQAIWHDMIDRNPKLYKDFIDFLTINVTEFFVRLRSLMNWKKSDSDLLGKTQTFYLERRLLNWRRTVLDCDDLEWTDTQLPSSHPGKRSWYRRFWAKQKKAYIQWMSWKICRQRDWTNIFAKVMGIIIDDEIKSRVNSSATTCC